MEHVRANETAVDRFTPTDRQAGYRLVAMTRWIRLCQAATPTTRSTETLTFSLGPRFDS
jgi:hypothetical protein